MRSDQEEEVKGHGAKLAAAGALPLTIETVEVDHDCTGARWIAQDESQLARLIAIIAMGQAVYAAYVLSALLPAAPKFSTESLRREAIIKKQEPSAQASAAAPIACSRRHSRRAQVRAICDVGFVARLRHIARVSVWSVEP